MKILAGLALAVSVGLNVYLWQQGARLRAETEALRASAGEAEGWRAEHETLKTQSTAKPATSEADARELARLRSELGPLRKQAADAESLRAQAAEAGPLRAQLTAAKKSLVAAEENLAEAAKLTPEEAQALKGEAQSIACISNMKQIGVAARLYAKEHGNTFPPDLVAMKDELGTPKLLFCPGAPGGVQAMDWTHLNVSTISYQFLNPNGNASDSQKPLVTCSMHGHVGLSDTSVNARRNSPTQ